MKLLLKISGLVLIFSVCTALGLLKGISLKARYNRLCDIKKGLCELKEHLRLQNGERNYLLTKCFASTPESSRELTKADLDIWNDFLKDFGMTDSEHEQRKCDFYISLFDVKINEARQQYTTEQPLYRNLGLLGGTFICIFFL